MFYLYIICYAIIDRIGSKGYKRNNSNERTNEWANCFTQMKCCFRWMNFYSKVKLSVFLSNRVILYHAFIFVHESECDLKMIGLVLFPLSPFRMCVSASVRSCVFTHIKSIYWNLNLYRKTYTWLIILCILHMYAFIYGKRIKNERRGRRWKMNENICKTSTRTQLEIQFGVWIVLVLYDFSFMIVHVCM